ELQKVKNKTESVIAFEDMSVMSRATSLANYELLGDANLMNTELDKYQAITVEDIKEQCRIVFDEANSNTMHYCSKN
ncbi:MAG: insulinase family protein, partial [Deinococcales bacterium]|nr:insulinase family protein [Chitinophagaceae bacterium]